MKKLIERYGKREVITNISIMIVLLLLIFALGYSYYIQQFKKDINPNTTESGSILNQTPTPDSSESSPVPTVSLDPIIPTNEPTIPSPTAEATPTTTPKIESNFASEDEVISYFMATEQSIETYSSQDNQSTILDKVKSSFITVVDFLFYDKEIGGYTFSELTEKAKIQIVKIALSIDNKIDQYFPNYKDTIKQGYTSIKAKLVKLYLDTTALLCEKVGETTCNFAKEDFQAMKQSFGFTFDLLKEAGGNLVDAIKLWYEIFSGK